MKNPEPHPALMRVVDRVNDETGPSPALSTPLTFADVFAGCGGLSLGLTNAGWRGRFAIEKNADAFETLRTNLVDGRRRRFDWPDWLPKNAISTGELLESHRERLTQLSGEITLLAGGPPCQGFSLAGRRTHSDPRNALTEDYIELVSQLNPRFIVIENVRGFTLPFKKHGDTLSRTVPYSSQVVARIEGLGYKVFSKIVDLSEYGVPQARKRFIIIAVKENDSALKLLGTLTPFELLEKRRKRFLSSKGLRYDRPIFVGEAISDLRVSGRVLVDCEDSPIKNYQQVPYKKVVGIQAFIRLMRKGSTRSPNSLRLPKHSEATVAQFAAVMASCEPGRTLNDKDRTRLKIKKQALTPLKRRQPSSTVTTLPDDIIHYDEPRILTVRENARIQTFPDWFSFTGPYTTGGKVRKASCPRYTQVGNAVPPLFAEAIGQLIKHLAKN